MFYFRLVFKLLLNPANRGDIRTYLQYKVHTCTQAHRYNSSR